MNLKEMILQEHSKAQTNKIIAWVGDSQKRFDDLFYLFINDEYRVVQRAGWPLSYIAATYPQLIQKHFSKLIQNLHKTGLHNAVKRNTVRLLQEITIPKKFHGEIMSLCFDYISSPDEAIAVKAFSLTILQNLSAEYPDIKPELKTIIHNRWDFETAAFHSRARKILKSMN